MPLNDVHSRIKKHAIGWFSKEGWVCYFWFIDWWHWSLGFNIYLPAPNIEIHLPFGFIRIGRQANWMKIKGKVV